MRNDSSGYIVFTNGARILVYGSDNTSGLTYIGPNDTSGWRDSNFSMTWEEVEAKTAREVRAELEAKRKKARRNWKHDSRIKPEHLPRHCGMGKFQKQMMLKHRRIVK